MGIVGQVGNGFGAAGPPRETTFAQIEKFGHQAGRMVARAIDARLTEQHAAHFAGEEPCPACGEKHPPKESRHDLGLQTEDGGVRLREPAFHCPLCERDFFPQRIPLRIDGGSASPAVLEKKMLAAAYAPSYSIGELLLRKIGGVEITGRGLNKAAVKIGSEMVAERDARPRRTSMNRCRGSTLSRRRRWSWRASAWMADGCKRATKGG